MREKFYDLSSGVRRTETLTAPMLTTAGLAATLKMFDLKRPWA